MLSCQQIRELFVDYFVKSGHQSVASSSLIPAADPTLLFVNAGMVQFKDVFLGEEKRDYSRAVSIQRCVRAGGKHNDLENVGFTARHHTFFEMLGNFSFGDYFKREAINFAWKFLTEVAGLPAEKLWVTVYTKDDEAADIWLNEIGVNPKTFSRCGAKDNFWQMGETGPCGPCTEIFYDHGADVAGGPPGTPEEDGDRYIEIWNLVFMQYDRDESGELTPLPKPSVDTGMGLERIAAVMQGVHSNYDIDLFQALIKASAKLTETKDLTQKSLKVISDHIRSAAFLIIDGVRPSNEGRGYVLRRIMRRAIRHGYKLGQVQPFFYKLVATLVKQMGKAYPELHEKKDIVEKIILKEEEQFAETLDKGMKLLEHDIASLQGKQIPGETVFKLYDTFGFPVDLTADIARERGLTVDEESFCSHMEKQRQRSQSASQFKASKIKFDIKSTTQFTGYDKLQDQSHIIAIFKQTQKVDAADAGDEVALVLESTPFYAESGGQIADTGSIETIDGSVALKITDVQKQGNSILHFAQVESGSVKTGDEVVARVDEERRSDTRLNHSATHLLHAALREILGEHVVQKGSLVEAPRLRFDFSHVEAMTQAQVYQVEHLVNAAIRKNYTVETTVTDPDSAKKMGALALFGEKYGNQVRVLSMGDFSTELCGGTHVNRTGDIGLFKITSETGIAAGVRRLEAVTGHFALSLIEQQQNLILQVATDLKASPKTLSKKIIELKNSVKTLQKDIKQLKSGALAEQSDDILSTVKCIADVNLLIARLDGSDVNTLRDAVDRFKSKLEPAIIILASANKESKIHLLVGVSKAVTAKVKAGELVNFVAQQVGGRGGGRPDMAQAGGSDVTKLDEALASVTHWVSEKLEK